eukprot:Blabericola_migrator_1__3311@NODE_1976_length_3481_cov_37_500586_g1258_i0_p3_GENE_NODE_1976_length_3481_cov_37_500586_g1258_i0NODE_1976_length_3481_cov_37_500586_g1258_i0_p3_ORF_typecomplete_len215_score23_93_NODE_1976_length_3481_cov_37_500586_g1258_i012861930
MDNNRPQGAGKSLMYQSNSTVSSSPEPSSPRVHRHHFQDFVDPEAYEKVTLDFKASVLSQWSDYFIPLSTTAQLVQPLLTAAELTQRKCNLENGSPRTPLAPPGTVRLAQSRPTPVLPIPSLLHHIKTVKTAYTESFLCSTELDLSVATRHAQSRPYNISIGTQYVCQMTVVGGVVMDDYIEGLLFPSIRDYSKAPVQVLLAQTHPSHKLDLTD